MAREKEGEREGRIVGIGNLGKERRDENLTESGGRGEEAAE